jgi:DsbC/DsbD-like thiol-disulfide interchange protein
MWREFARIVRLAVASGLSLALAGAPVGAAEPGASEWAASATSAMRLVTAGGLGAGAYLAGVEIRLQGDGHTYWRHPGDAGVPPEFMFDGSENLSSAVVRYPAPRRFKEGGVDVFGYMRHVIFPLDVTPADPSRPVVLALRLRYAACEKICIPAEGEARLRLTPDSPATEQAPRVQAYSGRVPAPLDRNAAALELAPLEGRKPAWSVTVRRAGGQDADLFAEAPGDWYFDTKKAGDGFRLELAQRPSDARDGKVEVRLTYVAPNGQWETNVSLDAGLPRP